VEDKLSGFRKMVDDQVLKSIYVSKIEERKILDSLRTNTNQGNRLQYYFGAIAALLLMGIIGYSFLNDLSGYSQDSDNQTSSVNGSSGTEASITKNIFDTTPSNEEVTVTFSAAEQELIREVNGIQSLVLSSHAFIPLEKMNDLTRGSSEPKIEATKNADNTILVKATFPIVEGDTIILMTKVNKYGSAKDAIESVNSLFPHAKTLSISGKDAILYETNGKSEVLILEEKYVYSISGGIDSSILTGIAEQIVFSE
jgi:hypothetical protein